MADTLRRRVPDAVVAPMILVAFTDCWVFRRCGLHAYGFSPFFIEEAEMQRIHGNDERLSLENLREGRARLHRDADRRGRRLSGAGSHLSQATLGTIRPHGTRYRGDTVMEQTIKWKNGRAGAR